MTQSIDTVTVKGYKNFKEIISLKMNDINVLIGCNGSGKSNFLGIFDLLAAVWQRNLQIHVNRKGGPDTFLFRGRKVTERLEIDLKFHSSGSYRNGYSISLVPTEDNRLIIESEKTWFDGDNTPKTGYQSVITTASDESSIADSREAVSAYVRKFLSGWKQYHFHDTSAEARVKRAHKRLDNIVLKPDAANLGAFVLRLKRKYPAAYHRIVSAIRQAAPFFGGFQDRGMEYEDVELEWYEDSDVDTPLKAHVLSDGTLRFICLAVLLLQPTELMPEMLIIDEPELGLHPMAIRVLVGMLNRIRGEKQVIVATQSSAIVDALNPEDVLVLERKDGLLSGGEGAYIKRLTTSELEDWLEEYTLGELWIKNVIGGAP